MEENKTSSFGKVAGLFDSGWKMIAAVGSLAIVIYTISVFFYKQNETGVKVDQLSKDVKQSFQELQKDWQAKYDDQHDLIIKNMQSINAVKQAFNDHEISAAEFRGRVKQILKIQ